jgi:hypothetical protein
MSRLELLLYKLTINLNDLCLVLQVDTRIVIFSRLVSKGYCYYGETVVAKRSLLEL